MKRRTSEGVVVVATWLHDAPFILHSQLILYQSCHSGKRKDPVPTRWEMLNNRFCAWNNGPIYVESTFQITASHQNRDRVKYHEDCGRRRNVENS